MLVGSPRPGDPAVPIVYDVERMRDGRSFSTRRIVARQHGRPIYFMTASFQVPEEGFEHQDVMPVVPAPEDSMDVAELFRRESPDRAEEWLTEWAVLEMRAVGDSRKGGQLPNDVHPAHSRLWMRISGKLDDDELTHRAAFTYASDMTLLGSAPRPGSPGRTGLPKVTSALVTSSPSPTMTCAWWRAISMATKCSTAHRRAKRARS